MHRIIYPILLLVATSNFAQPLKKEYQQQFNLNKHNTGPGSMATDYNVIHYNHHVDSISLGAHELKCHTGVTVVAELANVSTVQLDLLGFDIDSIVSSGYVINYSYNDTLIDIQLNPMLNQGDTAEIWIYYHGAPAQDASGWGGFYFNGSYAFNLGVGFVANPHNFGRAWFPCVDNFVSRSTYDFYITTAANSKAFCNGVLQQSTVNPNGTVTWHWKMNHTIPSYLASMAVAPYYTLQRTSNGLTVEWAAEPVDTNNILATFANLDTILYSFINAYGAYPFDRVGYCLIPFNSGAMEHATSIHIGRAFVNGSQTYATLWAHELSHMWWGDKVTCQTAEDMWLNEGFATYNEAYYTQIINGPAAYRDWIRSNHRKVLQFAHTPAQDGSYLTMNNIPTDYTYGFHVYQKGADVVHTLRNYMGDSAFFTGVQAYMNNKAYSDATSADLRDELTSGSGINMTRFFDDWIFTPGFPHFSIDSVIYQPGGLDHYFIYTRQRSKGNTHLYEMPIDITFTNGVTDTTIRVVIDSATNYFHIPIYFYATAVFIDRYEKVSDAISSNEKTIIATGSVPFQETNATLNVQAAGSGPSIIRVEHNFVPPDPFVSSNPGIKLSDYHYWKVSGIFSTGFLSTGIFIYDGSTSATTGYLDNTFITGNEDSLVILFRQGAGFNWQVVGSYTHNIGPSTTDKRGSFTVDTLMLGEYTIGMYDYTVGFNHLTPDQGDLLLVSPNPSNGSFKIELTRSLKSESWILIYDMGGRIVSELKIPADTNSVTWNGEKNMAGFYQVVVMNKNKKLASKTILLSK